MALADPKRNSRDQFTAEAVLETVQNFLPAIADDFVQPGAMIYVYEHGAFVEAGGLSMRGDQGIEQMVPDADDLRFAPAAVHAQMSEHFGHDGADGLGR